MFDPKRRIRGIERWDPETGERLASEVVYGGNPEHKKRPADYDLHPPSNPRPGKTLCGADGEFARDLAMELLREGLRRGLVSEREANGWPWNVWAVSPEGVAFEAQLENRDAGSYHGYPMAMEDDLRAVVIREWDDRER